VLACPARGSAGQGGGVEGNESELPPHHRGWTRTSEGNAGSTGCAERRPPQPLARRIIALNQLRLWRDHTTRIVPRSWPCTVVLWMRSRAPRSRGTRSVRAMRPHGRREQARQRTSAICF